MFDPKVEAKELFSYFHTPLLEYKDGLHVSELHKMKICAKECAKIAVNRIIADYKSYRVKPYLTLENALSLCEDWEEVLIEIEKL